VPSVQRLAVHMEAALVELEAAFLKGAPPRAGGKRPVVRKKSSGRKPSATRRATRR
jgi:hypothetical protein